MSTLAQRCCSILVTRFSSRAAAANQTALTATHRAAPTLSAASFPSQVFGQRSFSSPAVSQEISPRDDIASLSNDQLADSTSIPGWDLVHTPPRKFPRGALVGKVVSDKMTKTVNVAVERYQIVPKYRKRVKYTRKFMAHDEHQVANLGDLVMIVPCQRISRHKHFMLREIIRPKGQL